MDDDWLSLLRQSSLLPYRHLIIRIYIHTYIHIYIHTYIYTYTGDSGKSKELSVSRMCQSKEDQGSQVDQGQEGCWQDDDMMM